MHVSVKRGNEKIAFSGASERDDLESDLGNAEFEFVTTPAMIEYESGKIANLGKIRISKDAIYFPKVNIRISDIAAIYPQRHYSLGFTLLTGGRKSSVSMVVKGKNGRILARQSIPDTDNFKTLLHILNETNLLSEE